MRAFAKPRFPGPERHARLTRRQRSICAGRQTKMKIIKGNVHMRMTVLAALAVGALALTACSQKTEDKAATAAEATGDAAASAAGDAKANVEGAADATAAAVDGAADKTAATADKAADDTAAATDKAADDTAKEAAKH